MKTHQRHFLGTVSLLTLLFAQPVFAATQAVEGYGTDTVAGYETLLRSSQTSTWQDVTFRITKPDGTVVNVPANSGQDGIAQATFADTNTREAGSYGVAALLGSDSSSDVHSFQVYPDKVSSDKSVVNVDRTIVQLGGQDSAKLSIQLFDSYGNPVSDHLVQVFSNRQNDHIATSSSNGVTDVQGKIQFNVSSPDRGVSEYSVLDSTSGTMISHKIDVAYVANTELMADVGGEFPFIDTANAATGTLNKFSVSGLPSDIQPNQDISFSVTAQDENAQTVQNYTGSVHFSAEGANSSNVTLPQDYTFKAEDQGTHQFSLGLSFKVAGDYKIVVTDLNNTLIQGSQDVTVGGGSSTQQSSNANITVDSPIAGTYSQNVQTISGKATAANTVKIYDNQQQIGSVVATNDGKYSFQTSPLSDGPHSIYAVMFDSTQTAKGTSSTVQFSIDTTPPTVDEIVLDPNTGIVPGTPITVKITSEPNLSQAAVVFNGDIVQLNPSSADPTTYVGSIQAPATAGVYPIDALVVDQLGNEGSYKAKGQVTVSPQGGTADTQQGTQQATQEQTQQQTQQVPPAPTNTPPSKVTGVLTYAGDKKVTLVWDAASDNDTFVKHYRIYYGNNQSNLDQYVDTKDAGTTWYVPNLDNGKEYFFAVSAFDSQGLESAGLSEVVSGIPFVTEVSNLGNVAGPIVNNLHGVAGQNITPPSTPKSGPELLWFVMGSGTLGGLVRKLRRKIKK